MRRREWQGHLSPAERNELWRRWRQGDALNAIARALDRRRLGVEKSYVFVNAFLYSAYGQGGATKHKNDGEIVAYRNRWLQAILDTASIEAVVCLGDLAGDAWDKWKATGGKAPTAVKIWHPTRSESSSRGKGAAALADAIKEMLANWNTGLQTIQPSIKHPDGVVPLVFYGQAFADEDRIAIPERDFPAGTPQSMIDNDGWATRGLPDPPKTPPTPAQLTALKRATIVVAVPSKYLPSS